VVVAATDCVVAPFDHRYVKPAGAVSVTEPPAQNVVGPPAVMAGVAGFAFTVTVTGALTAEQPVCASVTVTVYVPAADTVLVRVVTPSDQR
jgi:hypothetical protein